MAVINDTNRNPVGTDVGQPGPKGHNDAGTRASYLKNVDDFGRDANTDKAIGPNQVPGQDAGTAASLRKGRTPNGSQQSNNNPG